jgi:protein SCO1/2
MFGGNESAVRELSAALGVSFYRAANGDYQHSLAIFILDSDGVVRSQQDDLQRVPQLALAALKLLLSRP